MPLSSRGSDRGLVVFSVTWSVYALIHLGIDLHRWILDPIPLLLGLFAAVAAVGTIFNPSSLRRLGVLMAAWSVQKIYFLPFVPNHIFLTLCIQTTVLLSIGWVALSGTSDVHRREIYRTFAPLVRLQILILYVFTVFHKLNTDFLDPAVSCGWTLYQSATQTLPLLPSGDPMPLLAIYGTLVVETLIPVLLLFRRTRLFGIAVGIPFHFFLALVPRPYVASFSTLMIAAYTVFLSPSFHDDIVNRIRALGIPKWIRTAKMHLMHQKWIATGLVAGAVVLVLGIEILTNESPLRRIAAEMQGIGHSMYYAWAIATFALFGITVWKRTTSIGHRDSSFVSSGVPLHRLLTPGLVVALLLFGNGLSPYVGLKTEMSFSMFSNLRTEGGISNHLIVRNVLEGNGHQNDLVRILDGSTRWMKRMSRSNQRIPFFEVRRRASAAPSPDDWIKYERSGKTVLVRYAQTPEHEIFRSPPLWKRKLLRFRTLPPSDQGAMPCGH